jgi:CheY-like chemotaxis protein
LAKDLCFILKFRKKVYMTNDSYKRPVLLVEDNPTEIELTVRAFSKKHQDDKIEIARDGEEAIAWIKKWDDGQPVPAVILLDLQLPRYHGLEVLKKLKAHPQYCTIPVVILTTSGEEDDIHAAYKLGANSYIIKPVNFDKFIEVAELINLYWTVYNKTRKYSGNESENCNGAS